MSSTRCPCPQCGAFVDLPVHAGAAVCASCGSTLVRETPSADPVLGTASAAAMGLRDGAGLDARPGELVLRSVRCPQCAGPLGVQDGRRVLVCGHCGVRLLARERDGFSRWFFPVGVDRLRAVGAGSAWLETYPGIAKQGRMGHFTEAKLAWVPLWEYKALVAGWEFGSKLRTRYQLVGEEEESERLDLQLVREAVEEPQLHERRLVQAASDLVSLGATRPRLTGREPVLPLVAGELEPESLVIQAGGTAADILSQGRQAVLQPVSGALSPDTHLFALRESAGLLYYPLWLLRFADGKQAYNMVIDGRDGTVNSATAPADVVAQKMRMLMRVSVSAAAVAALLWLAFAWGSGRVPALMAAVIVSAVTILMVWRFRVQREVEYHEPFSG